MASKKPEHQAPPEIFYNEDEAAKYTSNTRIMQIQSEMSERALRAFGLCLLDNSAIATGMALACDDGIFHFCAGWKYSHCKFIDWFDCEQNWRNVQKSWIGKARKNS